MRSTNFIRERWVQDVMTTYKEFEEEIRERENLLKNILMHKQDYVFLSNPDDARFIRFFSKYPLFIRSRNAIFKLLCVEIHKLFSKLKNDKFKLTQLLEKIKKNKKEAEWKESLTKDDIKKINKLVNEGLKNKAIKGLRNYRNKYLAHTDYEKIEATFFIQELYRLIDIAIEIIDLLRMKVLKEKLPLEIYLPADDNNSIRELATN